MTPGPVLSRQGTYSVSLQHDGRSRRYLLHVPPAGASDGPLPLVIALHGGGGDADRMDDLVKITPLADREGFLVAFPDAVDKNWNDGRAGVRSTAAKENIDDVGFVRSVVDDIASKLPIDRRRVYATGISNGAFMSNRLACEAADLVAAVGLVAGTAPDGFEATCRPSRPVPVIAFLSTRDPLVPYEGGEVTAILPFLKRGRVVSAHALRDFWVRRNGCSAGAQRSETPDRTTADNSTAVRESFGSCADGAEVILYRMEGAGHTWPGGKQYLSPWLIGTTNRDIGATALIWEFFAAHPMPEAGVVPASR